VGYIDESLAPGERLYYRAHFHWLYNFAAWASLIVAAFLAFAIFDLNYVWPALLVLLVGAGIFLAIMVPIWTTEIGVTNQRIIFKRGLIQRETQELQLGSVEQVSFNQDFWGRILNYGKIDVHGTGDDDLALPAVGDPIGLRSAMQQAIGDARGESEPANRAPRAPNGGGPAPEGEPIRARPA
jgi:uncharacterized membrane protein YdbT with pleckstrin-like domain